MILDFLKVLRGKSKFVSANRETELATGDGDGSENIYHIADESGEPAGELLYERKDALKKNES